MLHRFKESTEGISIPKKFTWPFYYTPHPLCLMAASETQDYIVSRADWQDELQCGKMFGVLVVKDSLGMLGFLSAFSGNLAGLNLHEYFTPPIYDALKPGDFFKTGEAEISEINHLIARLSSSNKLLQAKSHLDLTQKQADKQISDFKEIIKQHKIIRDLKRANGEYDDSLIAESQHDKAELRRLKKLCQDRVNQAKKSVDTLIEEINTLREKRKKLSADLQMQLFRQYSLLNARGERKDLCDIFASTPQLIPPAGAGECAAPKLLQYAYINNLKPIAMAEFWWGESPKGEIRHHKQFYPSCISKCKPILLFMMQGLDVEPDPLMLQINFTPDILWEDSYMTIINKPSGMPTINGKTPALSVEQWAKEKYPDTTGPMIVHRLDQSTSGILVIAKDKETHRLLQAQFISRKVKKSYIALLDGIISTNQGEINLPLKPDYEHRPCQMVANDGKKAHTIYKNLGIENGKTRVRLYPITGRTHQLRVHSAHKNGLNCPIVGDNLYGKADTRLFLHAEHIEFIHPHTSQTINITIAPDF